MCILSSDDDVIVDDDIPDEQTSLLAMTLHIVVKEDETKYRPGSAMILIPLDGGKNSLKPRINCSTV